MKRNELEKEMDEAMKYFYDKKIDNEKGPLFTFALGEFEDGSASALVLIMRGKHKLKPNKTKKTGWSYNTFTDHKDYVTCINAEKFKLLFGKKLKPGEIRYGRLKLRMKKRKKK